MTNPVEPQGPPAEPPATEPTVAMPIPDLRGSGSERTPPGHAASEIVTIGPAPLAAASLDAQSTLGHYRILEPLGRGGMGVVYKAYHPGLDRMYALKVMQVSPDTPADPIERFLREARAVAKIGKHPNIVQVHDVGQQGATYYLAMDLVDGLPLDRAIGGKPMPNRTVAEIAVKVARALEVAHAAGIVHRDLKPSNILLGRDGTPQVSDFGLARDVSASARERLSQEGQVLGTLQYMSPEQASGEQSCVGPVSDVYGLGATLYEMLTGRSPFVGENQFAIWSHVVADEPVPPRSINSNVHPDLETICLKCLEKAPEKRYPSAQELAEELQRFLQNEPIRARPLSAISRAWRRASKYRAVVLPVAVAGVILVAVGAVWVVQTTDHRSQVAAGMAVGRQFREQEHPHDARDAFQRVLAIDPGNAEAAAGFAWADSEVKRIDAEAEAARARAVAGKDAAEEALAKSGLVQNVLARWVLLAETLRRMEGCFYDDRTDSASRREHAAPEWRRVQEFMSETPQDATSQSVMHALAGWARRLAGHPDEATAWMEKARTLDPDLPYGALMQALVAFSEYIARQPLPPVRASSRGITFGGLPGEDEEMQALRSQIDLLLATASEAKVWGSGIAQDFRQAIEAMRAMQAGRHADAEAGLTAVLGTAAMQVFRTEVYFARGKVRFSLKRFADGIEDMQRVIEARPRHAAPQYYLGELHYGAGIARTAEGADPRVEFGKAILAYSEATLGSPDLDILGHRGNVFVSLGDWEAEHGQDPRETWKLSIADLTSVLKERPDDDYALSNRGNAWSRIGRACIERGESGEEALRRARSDFEQALDLRGDDSVVLNNLGIAYLTEADGREALGLDPRECHDRAYAAFAGAVKADPDLVESIGGLGLARCAKARADWMRGVDPFPGFEEGIGHFSEAIRRDPAGVRTYLNRSNAYSLRARAEAGAGRDPLGSYDLALADLDEVMKGDPDMPGLHGNRGNVLTGKAAAEQALGKGFGETVDVAIAEYDEAIRQAPDDPSFRLNRGMAWSKRAEADAASGKDPATALDKAIEDFGAALVRRPGYAPAFNSRGIAWMTRGDAAKAHGEDPSASWEKALEDFGRAAGLDRSHWMSRANRGVVFGQLGRTAEAIREFEAALVICPGQPGVTKLLDEARKKLGEE